MDAAKRFCREGRGVMTFLTLLGTPGIGKTVAASYVVVDFCRSWPWNERPTGGSVEPVLYVQAAGLARLSSFEANDRAHLEALKDCRLLVLEDAGEEATEFGKGVMVELLMYRDAKKRRTVLCTSVTGPAFHSRYGEAVTSRLKAAGIVPNLQNEPSLRRRAA
jgi:DNA replication protein DnaC